MTNKRVRSERFERGLKTRREVLGPEYVDKSVNNASDFTWAAQEMVTEWCWDATWNRPGMDRRSRSILNLGMIAALGRTHEFKLHVRGAVNNGLSITELQEICLQIATYCGVPAAIESFRAADEVLKEMGLNE